MSQLLTGYLIYIQSLVKNIGKDRISLNLNNPEFTVEGEHQYKLNGVKDTFTHVISTVGSYELNNLFPFLNRERLDQINQLEYAKVIQVSLGFKKWNGIKLNAFGGLVPFRENRDVLGILFLSSFLKKITKVFIFCYRYITKSMNIYW